MNGTNSSAKHYDTVVIGSSAARTSRRHSSRQTRQKDCGGRTLYSLIQQIAPSTLKPAIPRHPFSSFIGIVESALTKLLERRREAWRRLQFRTPDQEPAY